MAMDFTDYTTLLDAIASTLHRTDLTAVIPGFVTLCESKMNRALNTADMEASTTLTLPVTGTVALPAAFHKARRLRLYDGSVFMDLTTTALYPSNYDGVTQGLPFQISIVGSNIVAKPLPTQTYTIYLDYYAKFTNLSGTQTNWILTNYPGAYLYGSLLYAAPYLANDGRIALWKQLFDDEIADINRADFEARFSQIQVVSDLIGMTRPPFFNIRSGFDY